MRIVLDVLYIVLMLFLLLLIFHFVMDLVQRFARDWTPARPMRVVLGGVYTITDPPLKFLRRHLPQPRLGGVALDLSFLVLMIIVYILISVVGWL